jgi:hypothetical protein
MVVAVRVVILMHIIAPVVPVPPAEYGIVLAPPAILFVKGFL